MRCRLVVVLASAVLLANTDAVLKSTVLPSNTLRSRSITSGRRDAFKNRILRSHHFKARNRLNDLNSVADEGANVVEERGFSASTLETLPSTLRSPVSQLDDWLTQGKSADDVFQLLTLDKAANGLLASPHLNEWISYMKRFNKVNPTKRTTVIDTLTKHYGDEGLARIIEAAKQVRATAGLAKRVQTEQIQRWLLAGETPESIFTLLKLDDAGESLFTQSQVVTWAKFLDDFNKADSTSATTLFSFLKSRYDEDDFVKMLIAAKNVPSTEKIATRIQAEQTALWLEKGKNPGVVFKLLKLDDVDVSIMVNPFFAAWVKYTEAFSKIHYGTKITTISVLSKYYRDDVLAKMILAAMKSPGTSDMATRLFTDQMRTWYFRKFAPEHVFKLLRLDQTKVPLLENPLFNVWARFVPHYRSLRPKEGGDLLTELKKVFSDERELITMLVQAWNVPKTNKSAMQILSAQLDRWVSAKTDPLVVFYLLRAEGAGKKDVRKLLYEEYRNALARLMKAPVRRNKI